ncbi:hypothetical protein PIROE2DRAFT_20040 [Piromyces sp. E2]|nr:hypothetical protein PIROE2DRAFT_20040 [Piromyces sp. E2]|eukprot:OUM67379.1 hypothetical protein PIROE2DRAFT_20040 [Piromyces sp. E2]
MEVGKMNISSVKSRYHKRNNQKTKSMSFDSKKGVQNTQKPPYSYAELIAQAIISVPSYKLPLNKIYEWISTNYPFYKLSETGWQNSIRHNLSLNNSFCKVQRAENDPGKGCYWTIVKDQRHKFETLLSKKVGTKLTATVVTKRSNPPKRKYSSYSDSESDLSESEYEDEDDMLYSDKIIIRPKKMRKSESSDDMLYTEKSSYNRNKKAKKLASTRKSTTVTQVPASPTPSPILTKREGNFSDNYKKYDEEEDSESMIMEEISEDEDFEDYPPSPQSPEFPIHTHKNYDFTFDLFPEHPRLDDEEEVEENTSEEAIKYHQVEDVARSEGEDEEESEVEESEEEESENEEFEFEEGENQDPLPTIKISKSAVSLYDDIQNQTLAKEENQTFENNEKIHKPIEMMNTNPVQKETISMHDKDDDVNVLEKYKNSYLSDYHGIDHNYSCYINDELDKQQYNYYLHSPIFNSLTCPELADMCFGVNLNTLDYTSLNEDFQNIPDKLDFVDMGVENWWRDETNTYPIY